ncbi:hypothetical protein [Bradyrhizobium sp. RDI18]|uniref:hypothetical protein n=1 Tax=Bradyrhizobium sp. RDI18 TaxID=3367400 RepID=UPI0037161003
MATVGETCDRVAFNRDVHQRRADAQVAPDWISDSKREEASTNHNQTDDDNSKKTG